MAKSKKLDQKPSSKHHGAASLHKLSFGCMKAFKDAYHKKSVEPSEKKEWKNSLCSVCMEFPHNAVLLLCSSYEKGCRPYMCATSNRFSNCLEQYKKAYNEITSNQTKISELLCPLCRGQVKGWTVVEPARKYLNAKKRTCMHDDCSFIGNCKELRKHVKFEHPLARPRDIDPSRVEKWKKLENERALNDVFSTIRSTMPGAIVVGDYVIERDYHGFSRDYHGGDYFRLPSRWDDHVLAPDRFERDFESVYDDDFGGLEARPGVTSGRVGNNASSRSADQRVGLLAARRVGRIRGSR